VYVAASGDLWGPNKERGVFRSTDGGATWAQTLTIDQDSGVSDIAIDPQSPNILYAAAYQHRRTVFGYNGGGPGSGLYRSTDGGAHWTNYRKACPRPATWDAAPSAFIARIRTSCTRWWSIGRWAASYRSEDKGASWARMSDTDPRPMYFSQIRVDPNNDLKIWLAASTFICPKTAAGISCRRDSRECTATCTRFG